MSLSVTKTMCGWGGFFSPKISPIHIFVNEEKTITKTKQRQRKHMSFL